ncbi:hypothetical protein [Xanthomonas bundabergensis]|uniref:hypothetical protein n=1 Tax=Xanthomonas bundabergensis TaxID=3160842 RepID=UPI003512907F
MQDSQTSDLNTLYQFAEAWLKRPLMEVEREQLRAFAIATAAQKPAAGAADEASTSLIDAERQRVQGLIAQMMQKMQDSRGGVTGATQANEAAVLRALSSAPSLDNLRPGQLRPPQNGESGGNQLVMAQIADRLANLVQREVQDCFDRQFGSLAQQMQAVVDAARAQGLIGAPPPAEQDTPPPPAT